MKTEKDGIGTRVVFDTRWFMVALAVMGGAFVACLVGTEVVWRLGGGKEVQPLLSLISLTAFPLASAVTLAIFAWRATCATRRVAFMSAGIGSLVGGLLLSGFMFANANRCAAIGSLFRSVSVVDGGGNEPHEDQSYYPVPLCDNRGAQRCREEHGR